MRFTSTRHRFLIYDRYIRPARDAALGVAAIGLVRAIERLDRKRTANRVATVMRRLGPLLPEHRRGRDNLRAAFPDKSDAEIDNILAGVWDNLGRAGVEFAHLGEFCLKDFGPQTNDIVTYSANTLTQLRQLQTGKPTIFFGAHLANWELLANAGRLIGIKTAVLFRRPNIAAISDAVIRIRTPFMGELVPTTFDAPVKLARKLESGIHVGMVVDQHYHGGAEVVFFGRPCLANPLIAKLARQSECPIRGLRVVRQADGNSFWAEVTEPIEPARDRSGRIDVRSTLQTITAVIESWVREHPEQWLWLHRRWR